MSRGETTSESRRLLRAAVVLPGAEQPALVDGAVLVGEGRILALGRYADLRTESATVTDAGEVLIPGLVDAHSHLRGLPLSAQGIASAPLEQWLCSLTTCTALDPGDEAFLGATDLLLGGVTGVQAMVHAAGDASELGAVAAAVEDSVRRAGIRALLTLGYTDRAEYAPEPTGGAWRLAPAAEHRLDPDGYRALAGGLGSNTPDGPVDGLVEWGVGPVAPQWASEAALAAIARAADSRRVHLHLHESRAQRHWIGGEDTALDRLDAHGLLTERLSAAHAVDLTDAEIDRLAAAGVGLVHCPVSNHALRVGTARVAQWLRGGIRPALGLDSHGDDPFVAMRSAWSAAEALGDPLTGPQVFAMATSGAARAMGVAGGVLRPGAPADLTSLDLGSLPPGAGEGTVDLLVEQASRARVSSVWVAGRRVVRDGRAAADTAAVRARLLRAVDADEADRTARQRALAPALQAIASLPAGGPR
ncbi:MAG: amidohydrolase family protein [Nocardioides sp.]|uniref:amidohydrolase family protein n=1 Tax=Nocardioides sp. TaxID=35761 RepID=UPI0039E4C860